MTQIRNFNNYYFCVSQEKDLIRNFEIYQSCVLIDTEIGELPKPKN
ncbi:MAG: hypothetical protein ACD_16C00248G0025 [uncultured bacterium]|nr:MAG: hypothetical protein ACD_16C00248G0025 [uncultured bacterium]